MRSWTPGSPWGILVKSSFPMALCLMVKGRWSDVTTLRVSLWWWWSKGENLPRFITARWSSPLLFLTFPAGSSGSWVSRGPGGEEAPWRGRRPGPSLGGSTACRSAQSEQWWFHRGPPFLGAQWRRSIYFSPQSTTTTAELLLWQRKYSVVVIALIFTTIHRQLCWKYYYQYILLLPILEVVPIVVICRLNVNRYYYYYYFYKDSTV